MYSSIYQMVNVMFFSETILAFSILFSFLLENELDVDGIKSLFFSKLFGFLDDDVCL